MLLFYIRDRGTETDTDIYICGNRQELVASYCLPPLPPPHAQFHSLLLSY